MKKILAISSLSILAVSPLLTVVSCSSNNSNYQTQSFDTKVKYNNSTRSGDVPTVLPEFGDVNIYQPNENENALNMVEKIQNNLTVEQLNIDFKTVLQDFYEAYEAETAAYEIEIEKIVVKSKNDDGSFNVDVTYELDKNRDNEQLKTETIKWTPKMKLIDQQQIDEIKNWIISMSSKEQNGFDLKDIKELFLGEKDEDDFDDKGIFDKISIINKDYDGLTSLLAYEISINDIFSQLGQTARANVDVNTKFLVPSLYLNTRATVFVPNQKPDMDYTQKPSSTLTKTYLDEIFGSDTNAKVITQGENGSKAEIINTLNQLFSPESGSYKESDLTGLREIKQLTLINPVANGTSSTTNEYQLVIEFVNSKKIPDMIVFYASDATTNPIA